MRLSPADPPAPIPPWHTRLRGSFLHTGRTLTLAWRSSPGLAIALAALTTAAAALSPVSATIGKYIVDAVVAAQKAPPLLAGLAADRVLRCVSLELGAVAAIALLERALSVLRATAAARLAMDVNVRVLEKALTFELRQ